MNSTVKGSISNIVISSDSIIAQSVLDPGLRTRSGSGFYLNPGISGSSSEIEQIIQSLCSGV